MRKLLRIKLEGAEIIELYTDAIIGFDICYDPDYDAYELGILTRLSLHIILSGTFDQCHYKLNKIHQAIENIEEIITLQ